jgi:hypothetical protein
MVHPKIETDEALKSFLERPEFGDDIGLIAAASVASTL